MIRKIKCQFCGEKYWISKGHTCPNIFIHNLKQDEIIIRGNDLDIKWVDDKIVIWNKDKNSESTN